MASLEDFFRGLQGFGAGVQGQGPQFMAGLNNQRELRQQKAKQLSNERKQAMAIDASMGLDLLNSGDVPGFNKLMGERLQLLGQDPNADPTDTAQILQRVQQGDVEGVKNDLGLLVKRAEMTGFLEPKAAPQAAVTELGKATQDLRNGLISQKQYAEMIKGGGGLDLKELRPINKEVGNLVQGATDIRNSAASLLKLSETKSPTDKLAAIFKFMKALDPRSVVREGEQQQAVATGGLTDVLLGYVNQIKGTGTLSAQAFDNMVTTAQNLANQSITDTAGVVDSYLSGFGQKVPEQTKINLRGRVPKLFEGIRPGSTSDIPAPKPETKADAIKTLNEMTQAEVNALSAEERADLARRIGTQ